MTDQENGDVEGTPLVQEGGQIEESKRSSKLFVLVGVVILGIVLPVVGIVVFGASSGDPSFCGNFDTDEGTRALVTNITNEALENDETELVLNLGSEGFTCFPPNMFQDVELEGLKTFTTLKVQGFGLSQVSPDAFAAEEDLEITSVTFTDTQLSTLPSGLFKNMPKIASLSLPRNRLTDLAADLFADLQELTTVSLDQNPSLEKIPEAFRDIPSSVTSITFARSISLVALPEEPFIGFEGYDGEIDFTGTRFPELFDEDAFTIELQLASEATLTGFTPSDPCVDEQTDQNTRTLIKERIESILQLDGEATTLSFRNMGLNCLPRRVFDEVSELPNQISEIDFSNNELTEIKFDALHGPAFADVVAFSVAGNSLLDTGAVDFLTPLNNLAILDLSGTAMSFVEDSFPLIPLKLNSLKLANTQMTKVQFPFDLVDEIINVDLSGNSQLKAIEDGALAGISIETVDIKKTPIVNLIDGAAFARKSGLNAAAEVIVE